MLILGINNRQNVAGETTVAQMHIIRTTWLLFALCERATIENRSIVQIGCLTFHTFMLVLDGTEYLSHGTVYDGAALGAYVAMASTTRLPTIPDFGPATVWATLLTLFSAPFLLGISRLGFYATLDMISYQCSSVLRIRPHFDKKSLE